MSFAVTALALEAEVLDELGLSASTRRLERISNGVSARIAQFLGFNPQRQVWDDSAPDQYEGSGVPELLLRTKPIESVQQVIIDGDVDTIWTQSPELDEKGRLYRPQGWRRKAQREVLTALPNLWAAYNITIQWIGGWWLPNMGTKPSTAIPLPDAIQEVAIEEIAYVWRNPLRNLKGETTPGGWKREYSDRTDSQNEAFGLHKNSIARLNFYRRKYSA